MNLSCKDAKKIDQLPTLTFAIATKHVGIQRVLELYIGEGVMLTKIITPKAQID